MPAPTLRARLSMSRWKSLRTLAASRAKPAITAGDRRVKVLLWCQRLALDVTAHKTYFSQPADNIFIIGSILETVRVIEKLASPLMVFSWLPYS